MGRNILETIKGECEMISAVDLKAGMTFIQDGKLIRVLSASHHKPGKGNTVMRTRRISLKPSTGFLTRLLS